MSDDMGVRCRYCTKTFSVKNLPAHVRTRHMMESTLVTASINNQLAEERELRKRIEEAKDDIRHWLEDDDG